MVTANKIFGASLLTLLAISIIPAQVASYDLTGQISSDLYAYQGSDDDHLRPYFRFRGNGLVWRSPDGRFLRLHTSLRWTSDFADKLPADPELFVYDAYAHLSRVIPQSDLYVGRQFVYSGVGSALMDGGRIEFRRNKNYSLNVFGGSWVASEDPEAVQSLTDDLVVGGRFGVRPDKASRIGLSWMLRRRGGDSSFFRVGVEADRYLRLFEIYGRVSYNAIDYRLADLLGRVVYRPGTWYFSGEYHWREPLVPSNSIFTLLDFDRCQIGRVEARRRVWRQLSIVTHAQADLTGGDESWRTGVGFSTPFYSLSWIHQTGYGGENDGVTGYANRPLGDRWDCYATANLFRYRVQREQLKRSDAYASTVGLRWRAGWGITITAEGQYLRNAVLKDDGRFLLRVSKDFAVRSNGGREES